MTLIFISVTQVLGDRSIKYKYLNPNTVLIALGSSPYISATTSSHRDGAQKGTEAAPKSLFANIDQEDVLPSVTLILLDSTTGRILHSQVQLGATGPVRLLYTEDLAVTEFWDVAAKR